MILFGNYCGQPRQRRKGDRVRVNFTCDRHLYQQVKEDAELRNLTVGNWLEQAIANQLHALSDLPAIEMALEAKLLEILMHRNASRRQNSGVNMHKH